MDDRQFVHRAAQILHSMSLERKGYWRQFFRRWHISDEPLRNDAANLLREAGIEFAFYPQGTQRVGDDQEYLLSNAKGDKEASHDWPDIPSTPEQRKLIADHNAKINREFPNLRRIDKESSE